MCKLQIQTSIPALLHQLSSTYQKWTDSERPGPGTELRMRASTLGSSGGALAVRDAFKLQQVEGLQHGRPCVSEHLAITSHTYTPIAIRPHLCSSVMTAGDVGAATARPQPKGPSSHLARGSPSSAPLLLTGRDVSNIPCSLLPLPA